MAHLRGVGPDAADALEPGPAGQHVAEVRRMRAVHHVVGRIPPGRRVASLDRLAEPHAGSQPAVGLDGEGDHRRHPGRLRRPGDPDALLDVGHRRRGDQVDAGIRQHPRLPAMVGLGLPGGHEAVRRIAVAARPDDAAQHDRRLRGLRGVADARGEGDRRGVGRVERLGRVAERRAPVRIRPPGHRVEHEPAAVAAGDLDETVEIAPQHRPSGPGFEQRKGGERRQLDPLVKDQHGLEAAVGQK